VLIVDDVLATGGTAAAAARLVTTAGAQLVGLSVLLELEFLGGRAAFTAEQPDVDVHALLTY
jgi:adenine phosphoribosyltransferase